MPATIRTQCVSGLAAIVGVLLAGCAQNAEAVFRQQHQVSIALTHTILDAERAADFERAQRLYLTEEELNEACAPLQEAAYREMHEQEIDGPLEFAIVTSLDDCRATAREVAHLLRRVDPETARYFLGEMGNALNGAATLSPLGTSAAVPHR
jgi:hypothetical protein